MKNHLFIASVCITLTSIMHAESFDSFEQAFVAPEKATTLSIKKYDPAIKHLPSQLGTLSNLKVLILYGALDPREIGSDKPTPPSKVTSLPGMIGKLQNLEELDLGRNGIKGIPSQIASLQKLKRLALDYNDIHELPPFVGNLKNLRELSVCGNGGINLPKSLSNLNGLKIFMGNNYLKIKDQEKLRRLFPKAIFSFENEFDDGISQ